MDHVIWERKIPFALMCYEYLEEMHVIEDEMKNIYIPDLLMGLYRVQRQWLQAEPRGHNSSALPTLQLSSLWSASKMSWKLSLSVLLLSEFAGSFSEKSVFWRILSFVSLFMECWGGELLAITEWKSSLLSAWEGLTELSLIVWKLPWNISPWFSLIRISQDKSLGICNSNEGEVLLTNESFSKDPQFESLNEW